MLSGRCACNAVAYEVSDEFVAAYNCHCSNCRALRCDAASACRFSIGLRATGTSTFRMGRSSTSLTLKPMGHMFVGSKAPWHEILDDLPQYDEYP